MCIRYIYGYSVSIGVYIISYNKKITMILRNAADTIV